VYSESGKTGYHWYAIHTRSNFETRVATEFASKELDFYLPVFNQVHQWKDRKKAVRVPVFPGYLFVRFEDQSPARTRVLQTTGVVRILGSERTPEPVPDQEISFIQQMLQQGQCSCHPLLREGSRVQVRRGPLKGLQGRLVRIKSGARLVVSISILSQSVSTEIDAADVEPIPEEAHIASPLSFRSETCSLARSASRSV
jgi:transcription termination/antitermination protein NusG